MRLQTLGYWNQLKGVVMKRNILTPCVNWALTVAKKAITIVAANLLSTAIMSVLVKVWPFFAMVPGLC